MGDFFLFMVRSKGEQKVNATAKTFASGIATQQQ
jgi:hypothetical protein